MFSRLEASQAGLTVAQMAADGGVSERTVYRYLEDLQAAGFPLHSVKEDSETRWRFVDGYAFKAPRPIRASYEGDASDQMTRKPNRQPGGRAISAYSRKYSMVVTTRIVLWRCPCSSMPGARSRARMTKTP